MAVKCEIVKFVKVFSLKLSPLYYGSVYASLQLSVDVSIVSSLGLFINFNSVPYSGKLWPGF